MINTCLCGRGDYDDEKYSGCYECFLDRRSDYVECIFCGRWHNPKFGTCFKCRSSSPGREEAGQALRLVILARDSFTCRMCGSDELLQVDHIRPCRAGGKPWPWNLQTLCADCNRIKGDGWFEGGGTYYKQYEFMLREYFTTLRPYLSPDERVELRVEVSAWRDRNGYSNEPVHRTTLEPEDYE